MWPLANIYLYPLCCSWSWGKILAVPVVLSLQPGFNVLRNVQNITRCKELTRRWKVTFKHKHPQTGYDVSWLLSFHLIKIPPLSYNIRYRVLGVQVGAGLGKIGKYCPVGSGFLRYMYVTVKKFMAWDWLVVSLPDFWGLFSIRWTVIFITTSAATEPAPAKGEI